METHPDAGNEELLKTITELQQKLEGANAELASEREEVLHICTFAPSSGIS